MRKKTLAIKVHIKSFAPLLKGIAEQPFSACYCTTLADDTYFRYQEISQAAFKVKLPIIFFKRPFMLNSISFLNG